MLTRRDALKAIAALPLVAGGNCDTRRGCAAGTISSISVVPKGQLIAVAIDGERWLWTAINHHGSPRLKVGQRVMLDRNPFERHRIIAAECG